ncbi:MAG: 2-(1,2-epoxy-1,2-dihydrophenyl) acetyl-CoA isomerase [Chloroflexi bacterium]|nr:MAG: 2-(1,2-epoxy-1,2-dihydrophenyl) acetyl-CoA isomerase [Chloroflexota bacterium]
MLDPTPSNDPDAPARYAVQDGIATITLNRPEALNAMDGPLMDATRAGIIAANNDDSVRVVILTGAGRGFCAGGDLRASGTLGEGPTEARISILRTYMQTSQMLREMRKVTIAAINGAVAGAGLAWACAADLRYAADSAKFLTAFGNVGLSGDFGGTWTLPRIVGPAKARELYLLGDTLDAQQALQIGLVSDVFPADAFLERVGEIAQRLHDRAPISLQHIKRNLNEADRLSFSEALDGEAERHVRSGGTEDQTEAVSAFFERRAPVFHNR